MLTYIHSSGCRWHALVYQWLAGYCFASHATGVALWLRHLQGAVVVARCKDSPGSTLYAYLMCGSLAELCSPCGDMGGGAGLRSTTG